MTEEGQPVVRRKNPNPKRKRKDNQDKKGLHGCIIAVIVMACLVPVLAIISAIAIPSLLKTRIQSNEVTAKNSLKIIQLAQTMYQRDWNQYAPNIKALTNNELLTDHALVQASLSGNDGDINAVIPKSGYIFKMTGAGDNFSIVTWPVSHGSSGQRSYFGNSGATIYESETEGAQDSITSMEKPDSPDWVASY